MSSLAVALIVVVGLFVCVIAGVHIGFSLALMSVLGIVLMSGNIDSGLYILGTTSFEALRSYSFAVIPLFMLMGAFMSNSNIAKDLFAFLEKILKKIPGGLGVATVLANAVFAAITGVAIASAAIFAKISVPEMEVITISRSGQQDVLQEVQHWECSFRQALCLSFTVCWRKYQSERCS